MERFTYKNQFFSETVINIYKDLLVSEVCTDSRRVDALVGGSAETMKFLKNPDAAVSGSIEDVALWTAVIAYAAQRTNGFDKAGIFCSAALNAGYQLSERLKKSGEINSEVLPSLCYWAFAELFRLSGDNIWLEYCCLFEEKIFVSGEDFCLDDKVSNIADFRAAAVWALYRAGNAEYYRNLLLKASVQAVITTDENIAAGHPYEIIIYGAAAEYGE